MQKFYLVPGAEKETVEFGVPPEGAALVDLSVREHFKGRVVLVTAMEEIQRLHLRWWRDQPDGDRAILDGAILDGAILDGASLDGASLDRAILRGASLRGASLDGASLDGASLDGASLDRASLDRASLEPICDDIYEILEHVPSEVPGLLAALKEGRINGTVYTGQCACLVGTLANVRGCGINAMPGIEPNSSRLAEVWFLALKPGHTPENNPVAAITVEWIEAWLAKRVAPYSMENL